MTLDDVPQPLVRNSAVSESQRDRKEALALFSAARSLELREQNSEALQLYQRAFRYDPESSAITRAIVPLAIHLKRESVAVRYALKSVELDEDLDPMLLRRLGNRLEEEGDWPKALKLLQRAISLREDQEPDSADDVLLRMDAGRLLMVVGKYKEAADCFALVFNALEHPDKYALSEEIQKVLLKDPGPTYRLFGDCFLLAGRADEAKAAFEKANKLDPNEALWKLQLAQVQAKNGQPAKALASLDEALAKHVSSVGIRPYELLADVLRELDKKDELIPRLEKLHADEPQNVALEYFLAEKYLEAEMLDKAESLYAKLVEKSPTLTGYKSLLEIYRKTKRFDDLLAVLGQTVEKNGVLDTLGTDAMSLSKDPEMMTGLIEAARKDDIKAANDMTSYGKYFAMGMLALDAKQWETAGEFFRAAATAQPKQAAEVYLVWGIGLMVDNQSAEAVKVFQKGIDDKVLPENNPVFYFYLSGALAMEDRFDDALSAAQKAADLKKTSARFRSRIGWVYYRAKRYDEAVSAYEKIFKDFDDDYSSDENRDSLKEVRLALSNLCVLQKKIPEAAEWLEQVLDEFPDDIGALNDLGYLWADENKNLARSLRMIRKAVEGEPDNGAYRDSLGWALYRHGRYDEAIVELLKAAEKQPDGTILDHLGDAYEKANQPEKARDAWQKAVELFRKEKDEEKAKNVEAKIRNIDGEKSKQ